MLNSAGPRDAPKDPAYLAALSETLAKRSSSSLGSTLPSYSARSGPPAYGHATATPGVPRMDRSSSQPSSALRRRDLIDLSKQPRPPPVIDGSDEDDGDHEGGEDALDALIAQSSSILSTASECLTSLIESRERLRQYSALDAALERTMVLHEANFRRRASSQDVERSMLALHLEADEVLGPSENPPPSARRPSGLRVRASSPSRAHTIYISASADADSPSQTSESACVTPDDSFQASTPALEAEIPDTTRVGDQRAGASTPASTSSSFFSSWFGSAQPSPKLPPARDALAALANSPRPPPDGIRPRHRRSEASLALPSHLMGPAAPSQAKSLSSSPLTSPPRAAPSSAIVVSTVEARPTHVRQASRQPSISSDASFKREAVPRRDGSHAEWASQPSEGMTARERLLAMTGRASR